MLRDRRRQRLSFKPCDRCSPKSVYNAGHTCADPRDEKERERETEIGTKGLLDDPKKGWQESNDRHRRHRGARRIVHKQCARKEIRIERRDTNVHTCAHRLHVYVCGCACARDVHREIRVDAL